MLQEWFLAFDESKHPRDASGKWTDSSGGDFFQGDFTHVAAGKSTTRGGVDISYRKIKLPDYRGGREAYQVQAKKGDKRVGDAIFSIKDNGDLHPDDLFVEPQFRKQGIATAMHDVLRESAGANILTPTEVTKEGKAFYEKRPQEQGFKAWFGDSKVVDDAGKPLRVYHGSPEPITEFDPEVGKELGGFGHGGVFFSADPSVASGYASHQSLAQKQAMLEYNKAVDARDDFVRTIADRVHESAPERDGPRQSWMNHLLDDKQITRDEYDKYNTLNDATVEDVPWANEDIEDKTTPNVTPVYLRMERPLIVDGNGLNWDIVVPPNMERVDRTKYDGIIFKNIKDNADTGEVVTTSYVVFDANQIKSAIGNTGAFSRKEKRLDLSNFFLELAYDESKHPRDEAGRWSNAESFRAAQQATPEFKEYFGNSKVVDENGKPVIVYHGTGRDEIKEYDPAKLGNNGTMVGKGFYFGEDVRVANNYADMLSGSVQPVYLAIENPFDFEALHSVNKILDKWTEAAGDLIDKETFAERIRDRADGASVISGRAAWESLRNSIGQKRMEAKGMERDIHMQETIGEQFVNDVIQKLDYDGIVHEASDMYGSYRDQKFEDSYGNVWIAFKPEQVKSAIGNTGAFSKKQKSMALANNYDPNQPRDEAGKWTDYGSARFVKDFSVMTEHVAHHSGQDDFVATAHRAGKEIGKLEYTLYQGKIHVNNVEVEPTARRQGIATGLYKATLDEHPTAKLDAAMRTPEGTAFRAAFDAKFPDRIVKIDKREPLPGFTETDYEAAMAIGDNDTINKMSDYDRLAHGWEPGDDIPVKPFVSLARAQTKTTAFKEWFGDSKVVDANGEPLMTFHGTTQKWGEKPNEFDTMRAEIGAHFGVREIAGGFGDRMSLNPDHPARVVPVYLSIQNPLPIKDPGQWSLQHVLDAMVADGGMTRERANQWEEKQNVKWKEHWNKKGAGAFQPNEVIHEAMADGGYDGLKYLNRREGEIPREVRERSTFELNELSDAEFLKLAPNATVSWTAIYPWQIKSAIGNKGTWSKKTGDMSLALDLAPLWLAYEESEHPRGQGGKWTNKADQAKAAKLWSDVAAKTKDKSPALKKWAKQVEIVSPEAFKERYISSPGFKGFFRESKVIDYDDGNKPLEVFHGTLHPVNTFDREYQNPESFVGAGIYFSNTPEDASSNYADLGGPDVANKISRMAENLVSESENDPDSFGGEPLDYDEAKERVEAEMNKGANVIPAYLSMQNPVYIGDPTPNIKGPKATVWDYELAPEDPEDEDSEWQETGKAAEFMAALRESIQEFNDSGDIQTEADADKVMEDLRTLAENQSPLTAERMMKEASGSEGLMYADKYDQTTGDSKLYASEIVRSALERMGYDGAIDRGVWDRWGKHRQVVGRGMQGMTPDTIHYTVWHGEQVKSSRGNIGEFKGETKRLDLSNFWLALAFDESKHPRDDQGQWSETEGGGTAVAEQQSTAKDANKAREAIANYDKAYVEAHNAKHSQMMERVQGWVDKARDDKLITPEAAKEYAEDLNGVLYWMNNKCLDRVLNNVKEIKFYANMDVLTAAHARLTGHEYNPNEIVGGFWLARTVTEGSNVTTHGELHLDGDYEPHPLMPNVSTRKEIYAHELAHAVDRAHDYSETGEWFQAWIDEVKDPALAKKEYPLSRYGAKNHFEGFAEFGRLINTQHKVAKERFPKMYAFWKSNGLV